MGTENRPRSAFDPPRCQLMHDQLHRFYDDAYSQGRYCTAVSPQAHSHYPALLRFIQTFELQKKSCLEIGCGRGAFQDLVDDYTGLDITDSVRPYLHKPFRRGSATELPFPDNRFDAIWTIAVLEHVPGSEKALDEMRRVLRPRGMLLLAPAWQCRSWAAQGYPVRPYSDFNFTGKLIKASIPIRDSIAYRSLSIFPGRVAHSLAWSVLQRPTKLRYRKLVPNYDRFWMSDGDAVNSIDPYEAILWFVSRGDECVSYPRFMQQILVRTGGIVFRIRKGER
jgi:ubiquinone/menaquinone biosynthesis C-methylase UbiE